MMWLVTMFQWTVLIRRAQAMDSVRKAHVCARRAGREQTAARLTTKLYSVCLTAPVTEPLTSRLRRASVSPCGQETTAPEVRGENIS